MSSEIPFWSERRAAWWVAASALVVLAAAFALGASRSDSMTVDEPTHLQGGIYRLLTGDSRFSPDIPPLAPMWAALPAVALGTGWQPAAGPADPQRDFSDLAQSWLGGADRGDRLLLPARATIVALLLALCLTIAFVADRLFGPSAALFALFVTALDPTLLAHGHYVTTDVASALSILLTILAVARLAAKPTPARFALSALALSASALVKFSWFVVLAPMCAMAAYTVWRRPSRGGRLRQVAQVTAIGLGLAAAVWLAVWAGYGFRFTAGNSGAEAARSPVTSEAR